MLLCSYLLWYNLHTDNSRDAQLISNVIKIGHKNSIWVWSERNGLKIIQIIESVFSYSVVKTDTWKRVYAIY